MKILMIITDSSGYKTYLELKNYLNNNNKNEIELNYHYINANIRRVVFDSSSFIPINSFMNSDFEGEDEILAKYFDNYYKINKKYGYAISKTMFIESFLVVLKNYLNNSKYLLDNLNTGEYITTIKYKDYKDYIEFENQYTDIPEADLYVLSERNGAFNCAVLSIQLSIMLYLHRKFKTSKIIIGGGRNNSKNNPVVDIFNAIGKNYTNNKIEFCVGDIGPVISNYINGVKYNYSYGMNKKEVLDLNISEYEMKHILNNNFGMSFTKGCINNCPFCMGHNSSKFDFINDYSIYEKYFIYLNENYPDTNIVIYDNESNHTEGYLSEFLTYILKLKIKNKITMFLDVKLITDEDIELIQKCDNLILNISIDYIDIDNKINIINNFNNIYNKLKNNNININKIFMVANVPTFKTINNTDFIKIFNTTYNNNEYADFELELSSDIYINSDKYGISFQNYVNNDSDLIDIENELNNLPIIYYRSDYNRKELLNEKYKLLNKIKSYLLLYNNNKTMYNILLGSLVFNCYINHDLIDNKIKKLDDMINKFIEISCV